MNNNLRPNAIKRIKVECQDIDAHPEHMLFVSYDLDDLSSVKIMFIGPSDSPYSGGFFYFDVKFPKGYYFEPPNLTFLTAEFKEKCRLHPNLYQNGKVCLSTLNTWGANEWSPALTVEKIFLTIQMLLDNNPIAHEPGHEHCKSDSTESTNYRTVALYRTLETAVIGMLRRSDVPEKFRAVMKSYFVEHYDDFLKQIDKLSPYNNTIVTCFHDSETIDCKHLLTTFKSLYDELNSERA